MGHSEITDEWGLVCDRFVVMSHGAKVFEARKEGTTIEEVTDRVIRT